MYHDGVIRFENYGLSLVAHLYNQSAKWHGGKVEAVYNSKGVEDCQVGSCVLDFERGIAEGIWPNPFQTDTCIGDWHYNRDVTYKTPKQVIDMLVNVVSRNGTLLLNFPPTASSGPWNEPRSSMSRRGPSIFASSPPS